MRTFRKIMNVSFGIPLPKLLLETGAVFIRTETELILKSSWVIPGRLLEAGYTFKYPTLDAALKDILNR